MEATSILLILVGGIMGIVGLTSTILVVSNRDGEGRTREYTTTQRVLSFLALFIGLAMIFGGAILLDLNGVLS